MTFDDITAILDEVHYKHWSFNVKNKEGVPYLQLLYRNFDPINGGYFLCKSRKWMLSFHMCRSEIVQTALAAVKMVEEHEIMENFKYRGQPIFHPHCNVDELWELSNTNAVEVREEKL